MKKDSNTPEKVRCAVYCRKSIMDEDSINQEFNSLDAQREAGENYIASQKSRGWICLKERYDDAGFSGGNTERPALKKLLDDCKAGKIDMIIVYKLDRLSRSLMDFVDLQKFFEEYNVSFCSVTQEINTSTSAGRMMLNILISFGEYERSIIRERVRDKMAASKKRGMWMGGYVPFGYTLKDKKLYPDPVEGPIVKRIFERFVETQSPKLIAAELNREGKLPRTGKPWQTSYISRIIASHTYVGEVFFHGSVSKGEHDGIISKKLWDRAQAIVRSNAPYDRSKGVSELTVPLKGILRCGHCGGAMKSVFTNKKGKRYYYYYCDQDTKRGESTCPLKRLGSQVIEDAVKEQTQKIFSTQYFLERVSVQTGITIPELQQYFGNAFWEEATPHELNRIYHELFDKITVTKEQIVYEIRTAGIRTLTEGICNEHQ